VKICVLIYSKFFLIYFGNRLRVQGSPKSLYKTLWNPM